MLHWHCCEVGRSENDYWYWCEMVSSLWLRYIELGMMGGAFTESFSVFETTEPLMFLVLQLMVTDHSGGMLYSCFGESSSP